MLKVISNIGIGIGYCLMVIVSAVVFYYVLLVLFVCF
jgi:hypothetical protein